MTRDERLDLAIEKWKQNNGRMTMVMATGVGKTRTALKLINRLLVKNPSVITVVIVPTDTLKQQWVTLIREWNLANVTILIINSAYKHDFYCDLLVLDEIHLMAAELFCKVFERCNPRFILGLTATYERLDGREKLILDKYCPAGDTITIEEATKNGWLSPYKEYKVMIDVDLTEYEKANTTFLQHFAFFDFVWDNAMNCVKDIIFRRKYAKHMNCSEKEVSAHAFAWNKTMLFRKNFIANHPKKIEVALRIIQARQDKKIITFNSSIKICESYKNGIVIHSKKKSAENKKLIEEFSKAEKGILHTSQMANQGLDVKGLSVAIITGFDSSQITVVQRVGRCIRKEEGKEAEIFILVLRGTLSNKWFAKSHENMNYIEINEQELDKVLRYESINKKEKRQDKFNGLRY